VTVLLQNNDTDPRTGVAQPCNPSTALSLSHVRLIKMLRNSTW